MHTLKYSLTSFTLMAYLVMGSTGNAWSFQKIMVMPVIPTKAELTEGAAVLNTLVSEHFQESPSIMSITTEQEEALAGELTGNHLQIIKDIADKLGSDAALIISLHRFKEREGDKYSSDSPTSLAFEYKLIRSSDGRSICSGSYDETQEALTENVLNLRSAFKRGFKWISVEDMAKEAINKKFSDCPELTIKSAQ